jgi:hypothetical protein
MSRSIIAVALGVFGIASICLSIDSWLYAGHFLHHGQAAHISGVPTAVAEVVAGALALGVLEVLCRTGSHITSIALTLVSIFLIGVAADTAFGVGVVPQVLIPTHAEPMSIVIAGLLAGAFGYDLSPGSWRRQKKVGKD